ncbi:hypothetical protein DICVIV_08401 [Dictyocaulus viviparus]|uniref:Uncharacterized protein n=1 Tax=Dictyocaulus viviparus TaxID=29172 RepID=A0A0D8XP38_DICVI|nr:hypothetical protein DICVIV_08401 [Dictyocaulus viviparus]
MKRKVIMFDHHKHENHPKSFGNAQKKHRLVNYKGSVLFRSDSVSTIAIIRDIISEETTKMQIKLQMSCDLNDASVEHCLRLMHPRMLHLLNLEKRKMMASALKELEANNDDISFLSEENMKILKEHDVIFQEAERDSFELDVALDSTGQLYRKRAAFRKTASIIQAFVLE